MIGTTSVVVMISFGLGIQQQTYAQIEQYGGLTTLRVMGKDGWDSASWYGESAEDTKDDSSKVDYITEERVNEMKTFDHVLFAEPVFETGGILRKGKYETWVTVTGFTPEYFKNSGIKLAWGEFPEHSSKALQLIFGNQVIPQMYDPKTGSSPYWEKGELVADAEKDSMFLILNTDNYNSLGSSVVVYSSSGVASSEESGGVIGNDGASTKPAKKYSIRAYGMVDGSSEDYNNFSWSLYCDMDTLISVLQKEFKGKAIPGQPTTKTGKPLKEFVYTYAQVKVDDINNVNEVATLLRDLGYNVESNADSLEMMKQELSVIQAVLGGIGAISLLVAAIGIANTMMMAIYERTKEIGVMKVIGCDIRNIRQMFLTEAAFIGFIGGVTGIAFSLLISFVLNKVAGNSLGYGESSIISYIPIWLLGVGIIMAMLVGIVSGYFPARRAMRLSPLAAIRTE
jgi:ABC-type antimicrobial peptide transport system permease subunit